MTAPHALVVQHHELDRPEAIGAALEARGVEARDVRGFAGDGVPETIGDASALVLMGGPMSVDDEAAFPFLAAEKRLIVSAVDAGVPVLGVCLGAQLVAVALGGAVRRGVAKENGWHEVELTGEGRGEALFGSLPTRFTPFHWHDDAIVAPPGGIVLVRSPATPVQAFRFGQRILGLQFHLEVGRAAAEAMARAFGTTQERAGVAQQMDARIEVQARLAASFFGDWASSVAPRM